MNYQTQEGFLSSILNLPSGTEIVVRARNIRKERTGIHAEVQIQGKKQKDEYTMLAWSILNVERDEDRTRLVNSAYALISEQEKETPYPKRDLKLYFDEFCWGLWDASLETAIPAPRGGAEVLTSPRYLLKPYLVDGGGSILFGPPGQGKSFMLLIFAVSLDSGVRVLWPIQSAVKVLVLNLERSAQSVDQRLARINKMLGLPQTRPLFRLDKKGARLEDVAEVVKKLVLGEGINVLMLDSVSRAGFGDLTQNRPVNEIIDCLNSLCPTWFAIGHTPRKDESHVYGGVHFDAGADVMVQLNSEINADNNLGIGLQITKANDIPLTQQELLALEFHTDIGGIKGIRKAEAWEFPELSTKAKKTRGIRSLHQQIEEYLGEFSTASALEIAEALSLDRSNVSGILSGSPAFVKVKRVGHKILYKLSANVEE